MNTRSRVVICRFRMTGRLHGPANGRVGVAVIIALSSSDGTAVVGAYWKRRRERDRQPEGEKGRFLVWRRVNSPFENTSIDPNVTAARFSFCQFSPHSVCISLYVCVSTLLEHSLFVSGPVAISWYYFEPILQGWHPTLSPPPARPPPSSLCSSSSYNPPPPGRPQFPTWPTRPYTNVWNFFLFETRPRPKRNELIKSECCPGRMSSSSLWNEP